MDIYKLLNDLNIEYEEIEHERVTTIEEAKHIKNMIEGQGCKNLFLTDHKNNYYIYVLEEDKKANLKELHKILNCSHLSFASIEDLSSILNLSVGSVTPLAIINDKDNKVEILIDKDLINKKLLFHPNVNTKTISIMYNDLLKIIKKCNHKVTIID